jgi:hypothetical protein
MTRLEICQLLLRRAGIARQSRHFPTASLARQWLSFGFRQKQQQHDA